MPITPLAQSEPTYWGILQQELTTIQAAITRMYYVAGAANFTDTGAVLATLNSWFDEVGNAQQFVSGKIGN